MRNNPESKSTPEGSETSRTTLAILAAATTILGATHEQALEAMEKFAAIAQTTKTENDQPQNPKKENPLNRNEQPAILTDERERIEGAIKNQDKIGRSFPPGRSQKLTSQRNGVRSKGPFFWGL